ncbi:protein MEI2-like 4 isoform X2 [Ricinus communis]|uniref:protein MEI2-like 4 isoform X2 n=1 Tax=Ricinus communis TaxID=3988 RepID=UPI0007729380|nr:protein MEI2-like 4 isoform X2 [Ricinus communis]|eukprot:XP_015580065.1 protein MEI2-like 4 isoform X2 [Ricinus communis]
MPFEVMDQRGGTASSHYFEDMLLPAERQIGFWKPHSMPDHQRTGGMVPFPSSKLVAPSPLEKFSPGGALSVDYMQLPDSVLAMDQKEKLSIGEGSTNMLKNSWNSVDQNAKSWSSLSMQPTSYSLGGNRAGIGATQWESSLFSSSLSEVFNGKLRLLENDIQSRQPAKPIALPNEEDEPFESLEELEAQTIGNLLPAEDDLFSGVTDELGHNAHTNGGDDLEDFDLFITGGGMELEGDDRLCVGQRNSDFVGALSNLQGGSNGSVVGEHPYGEHPSRTLFVRNINSNVEDSELKALFEQYGDIRTLYTACKHRGFVMISYYDIRAARNAMRSLQNKPLRRRKLDIHYSIPKDNPSEKDINQGTLVIFNLDSSVSTEELHKIFGVYGEIKEIRETPHKRHHKFIEYYDIRSAEAALSALNRSDIAGKQIKLEPSRPGGTRRLMTKPEQEQDESGLCQSPFEDLSSGRLATFSPGVIASSCMENGSTQVIHSAIQSPVGSFIESHRSSSVPNNLPSPVSVTSISKQFGLHEPNRSMDEMMFGNQRIPSFHPHSLPEYPDGLANGVPFNSSSSIGGMAHSVGSKVTEGISSRHIQAVSSNGHLMELNGGVFGSSGNGSLPGHHYMWNNSNTNQQHHSSRMIWPNSSSFTNGVHAHHLPHMPGFPRAPPVMLNTVPAHHHVGSAPSVNPSVWERRHAYAGESPEASSFHLGSLGSVGSPHPMEIASHNIFSHVGGNCMDMTKNAGLRTAQPMCHIFPGRNPMISMPASFDSPNERVRNLSHRRIDSNPNHSDKKQYELDLDRIMRGEDSRTTLMIKNIPNKYTSKMLLAAIDEYCRGTYDFIYLPIDFKNKCNVGYAFINMIDPQQIIPFHKAFNGKKWEKFNSEKVASLAYARIQGKSALIAHFQNSSLMNEDKRCRPILFHTDGPNAGDPEPFPMGTNVRSRLGKLRTSGSEENHHGNPSTSANGEDSSVGTDSSGSD